MSKQPLPVVVGFGGINGAGRASMHHAFKRMTYTALSQEQQSRTLASLAQLMGLASSEDQEQYILNHTLIRRIESNHFDVDNVEWNRKLPTQSNGQPVNFDVKLVFLLFINYSKI